MTTYFACKIFNDDDLGVPITMLQELEEQQRLHEIEESKLFPETRCVCCQHEDPEQHLRDDLCESCRPSCGWGFRPAPNSSVEVSNDEVPGYAEKVWGS